VGQRVRVEVATAEGRSDAVVETSNYIYIIEYKVNQSPDVALQQIEDRGYATPYLSDPRKLVRVGMSFSSKLRGLESWKVV
ncbi:MAG: PD-(D/E)XK nuclease domain-containing protein, partial [Paludibacteraceae bacterium]|nr:PD-(D/E)XK nuclease domain-containing protein [Paludibacteraceae bacterium]